MPTRSSPTKKAFPLTVTGVVIAADAIVEKATKAVAVATALKLRIMNGEQIAIFFVCKRAKDEGNEGGLRKSDGA